MMAFMRSIIHCHKFYQLKPNCLAGYFLSKGTGIRHCHVEVDPKTEARLKKTDNLGDEYSLVYRAPYVPYCKIAYSLGIISCTVFPGLFSTLLYTHGIGNYPLKMYDMDLVQSDFDVAIFGAGLLIIILQLRLVIFKYPYRIYHNTSDDTYLLVFQHVLPWKNEHVTLKPGELKRANALFTWNDSLYEFGKKRVIIFDYNFRRPADFENMLSSKENMKSGSGKFLS